MTSLVRKWQHEEGDAYVVSLVRLLLGGLLVLSALREVSSLRGAHFADVFHMPMVPAALVPGAGVFAALAWGQLVLGVLVMSGRFARLALFTSALVGVHLLLCDRLAYHNNRYALFLFAFLLAFSPCDRAFVWPKSAAVLPRRGPLFAARIATLQLSFIYLASGGSKLLDSDWREGRVLGDRLFRATAQAVDRGVPPAVMEVLTNPALASALSKIAISTELFLMFALYFRRTRGFALWWGTMFHLTIEVTSQVELFGVLSLTIYALFAVPVLRERLISYDPACPFARAAVAAIRRLDWLARFEIRADPGRAAGHAFVLVDRDGARATGWRAAAKVARATPLLLPISGPLAIVAALFSTERSAADPPSSRSGDARADAW